MTTVTLSESRDRNITLEGVSNAEVIGWIEAGILAAYGPGGTGEIPADFALDADDTLTIVDPGQAGTPTILAKGGSATYRIAINETD